ncbi:hypothetical protein KEM55_002511, partial [Ascosphaera atra]
EDYEKHAGERIAYEDGDLPVLHTTTERKLMLKVDWHLLPPLVILYLLAFLDRVNISNATIFHLKEDLDIVEGMKYNTALTIFFVPYILAEVPSNILMKKLKPNVWLSGCMFLFGLVTCLQGLVQNWGGLMATRFFLGMFESGMFPGCFYLMGTWYSRAEAQKRFSFFFCSTTLAGAFGGLLASAIGLLQGQRGYNGWRWVFIIEGAATAVIGIILYFLIPGFPEEVKWLKDDQKDFLRAKLARDVGKAGHEESIKLKDVFAVIKDYNIWIGAFMYFGLIVPGYGYAYFAPTFIKGYGYGNIKTQLLSIAPWAAAFVFAMTLATLSDRLRHRFTFVMIPLFVCMAGFAMLLHIHGQARRHAEYAALFLITMGAYSAMPVIVCWFVTNLAGHRRKSIGTAVQVGFGNIGGIISTFSFLAKDAPNYTTGFRIGLGFCSLSGAATIAYLVVCHMRNRSRDRLMADGGDTIVEGEEDLGDLRPDFRYQL